MNINDEPTESLETPVGYRVSKATTFQQFDERSLSLAVSFSWGGSPLNRCWAVNRVALAG